MIGSTEHPLQVAIVGSGPSGFYAAQALQEAQHCVQITMIERLPTPYGLVRSGVAPDHPKLKRPAQVYDQIARSSFFHYMGNLEVGDDVTIEDLLGTHHAVILAYGARQDNRLGIPGEDLPGSHSSTEFVGWYNGHPDCRDLAFDLKQEAVVIVGQGNVALDVARILTKPVDDLRRTDIADHALAVLAESRIKEIHIVGRRGPTQAKFTSPELAEFESIPGCIPNVDPGQLTLNEPSRREMTDKMSRTVAKNMELFSRFALNSGAADGKRCIFDFFRKPTSISGRKSVSSIQFVKTVLAGEPFHQRAIDTGEEIEIRCQLIIRAAGFRGVPINGVSFDQTRGVLNHSEGRVIDQKAQRQEGLYAVGWIKRGASGIIGTNRADSVETVSSLLKDIGQLDQSAKPGWKGLAVTLRGRGKAYVTFQDWLRIDEAEIARGLPNNKPREKITSIKDMLNTVNDSRAIAP